MAEQSPEIARIFADAEERLKDAPVYDLRTLKAVHDYFEFEATNDTDMDAFLHAHIKKALRGLYERINQHA